MLKSNELNPAVFVVRTTLYDLVYSVGYVVWKCYGNRLPKIYAEVNTFDYCNLHCAIPLNYV